MGTMIIGYWIIQNIGYKNIGLYIKKHILKILRNRVFRLRTGQVSYCMYLLAVIYMYIYFLNMY